jgi:hypothetical protein
MVTGVGGVMVQGTFAGARKQYPIEVPPTISATGGLKGWNVGLDRTTWLKVIAAGKVAPGGGELMLFVVQLLDTNRLQLPSNKLPPLKGSTVK